MTDLMVGMLFIFIIMLMSYALNLKEGQQDLERKEQITQEANAQFLRDLQRRLRELGVTVEIDEREGTLTLAENLLFRKAKAHVTPEGEVVVRKLAHALTETLPCYGVLIRTVDGPSVFEPLEPSYIVGKDCPDLKGAQIESIFIEGHTDKDPMLPNAPFKNNFQLSARRAVETYIKLTKYSPALGKLKNYKGEGLVGISGYGETRPLKGISQNTEEGKRRQRRIVLRIVMARP